MFNYFKNKKYRKAKAQELYAQCVAEARQAVFYAEYGVPDTIDGRFEMIALHNFIVIYRLSNAGEKRLSQALFDKFFTNMEQSLREIGIGDMGVPKHMKRMMQGFNGRCQSYKAAMNDKPLLIEALKRNVYGTLEIMPDEDILTDMADFVQASCDMGSLEAEFASIETSASSRLSA